MSSATPMRVSLFLPLITMSITSAFAQQDTARKPAEAILRKALSCTFNDGPEVEIDTLKSFKYIDVIAFKVVDSVSYFRPIVKLEYESFNVTSVFGSDGSGGRSPQRLLGMLPGSLIGFSTDASFQSVESWSKRHNDRYELSGSQALSGHIDVTCRYAR